MAYLSAAAQIAFNIAARETQALNHIYIDNEHLFLGLCKIEDLLQLSKEMFQGISDYEWNQMINEIKEFSDCMEINGLNCKNARRRLRKLLEEAKIETGEFSGHRTDRCKSIFAAAEKICKDSGMRELCLLHLFSAIFITPSEILDKLLLDIGTSKNNLSNSLKKMGLLKELNFVDESVHNTVNCVTQTDKVPEATHKSSTPFLDKYGRDITKLARQGKLDPTIGRNDEIRKLAQVLVQKKKNNPILVGDAGVGKTCIVEGFAQRVAADDAPQQIRNFRIIELSMGALVAGTKYRGEFEEKLTTIIKESSNDPNIILFIDEIHTMVGAGSAGEGAMDAGNILKPALARGDMKCIGATTTAEYRKYIEKDAALERRFQLIWVDEPTFEEAVLILKGLKHKYEEYHNVTIPDKVIEKAVELSMRYLNDYRLPDKAIDIIDQACARKLIKTLSPEKISEVTRQANSLSVEDIACVVSERCRIPVGSLSTDENERLLKMEEYLKLRVLGQDEAVKSVAETIRVSKSGLKDPNKPLGIFLFLGATGTGKTELAKALAEYLFYDEGRLISFDMSEYAEKHTAAKLIGSPPGYVGHDEEGQLTSKIRTNPYSVILFDEIEKAHPDILNLFLQIFDEGRLTDSKGRKASFSEAIIVMTSNLGCSLNDKSNRRIIGFQADVNLSSNGSGEALNQTSEGLEPEKKTNEDRRTKWKAYEQRIIQAVESSMRPEILNRVQKKILFYPLDKSIIKLIIDKYLGNLNKQLYQKGIHVDLDPGAYEVLMKNGYSEAYGAREMLRFFQQCINEPLSRKILSGEINEGALVLVYADKNEISFKSE